MNFLLQCGAALALGAIAVLAPSASARELQGDPRAVAAVERMFDRFGGREHWAEARAIHEKADASNRRSIYLPLLRGLTPKSLEAFDPVEQTLVTGRRETTTVPGQDASITFPWTPTVVHSPLWSVVSMRTRVTASVPNRPSRMRTL